MDLQVIPRQKNLLKLYGICLETAVFQKMKDHLEMLSLMGLISILKTKTR